MKETQTVSTRYKVLDVRERYVDNHMVVALICSEFNGYTRRRIEIYDWDKKAHQTALMLAPGDIILVHETYNYNGLGGHRIDEIEY